jgi:site-specific DNA-methyltransferase (adenine-specific)
MPKIELIQGDCLEKMKDIPDGSVDMVLCDLPYGTTACKWDTIIPFEPLWEQYKRIIKDRGAVVLTSSQPFTSLLVSSNIKWFKYEWIWVKNTQTGMMCAGKSPMKKHENILVFCEGTPKFNEEKVLGSFISQNHSKKGYEYKNKTSSLYNVEGGTDFKWSEFVHANSVLLCNVVGNRDKTRCHPTQKPIALMEYLIRTYTNEGDAVLDNCMGSGTTGVACQNLNRNFIGIELDLEYFKIAEKRINENL